MEFWKAVDPKFIYVRRHEDVLTVVCCYLNRDSGSGNLQAGIQGRWMNFIIANFGFRPLRSSYFPQNIPVVPPQLSNASEERPVVDTASAQPRVIVFSRDLFRASSLDLGQRLLPCREDVAVSLGRNSAGRIQC